MRRVDPAAEATDQVSFGDWLARHGQNERTRRALWDLFSVASINVPGDDASLALAAKVVQTGLLGDAGAADIGVPALPLGEIHGTAAARKLAEHHATIRLSTKVTAIDVREGIEAGEAMGGASGAGEASARYIVRLGRGADEDVPADAVVLAVPHETAARLIPPGALPAKTVADWAGLGAAPIVNVHVIYDRKVMDVPFAAGVDSPVQWVFDRTRISGMHARGEVGQYLAISLSAADEYVDRSVASLREAARPGAGRPPASRGRGDRDRVLRHQGAARDVSRAAGDGAAAASRRDRPAWPCPGRLVDRHRLAGHDGGRRPKRPERGHGPAGRG